MNSQVNRELKNSYNTLDMKLHDHIICHMKETQCIKTSLEELIKMIRQICDHSVLHNKYG